MDLTDAQKQSIAAAQAEYELKMNSIANMASKYLPYGAQIQEQNKQKFCAFRKLMKIINNIKEQG